MCGCANLIEETFMTDTGQATSPSQLASAPNANTSIRSAVAEAARYTVIGLFVMYAVGFLIWHSFLATYGVSSIGFMQSEFLSAAFCYLLFIAALVVPPAVLYERWLSRKSRVESPPAVGALVLVWYVIIGRLASFVSSHRASSETVLRLFVFWASCFALVITLHLLKWKKKLPKFTSFFGDDPGIILMVAASFFLVGTNDGIDKLFLIYSICLYPFLSFVVGGNIRNLTQPRHPARNALYLFVVALLVISHVTVFGERQFGFVSRSVGGAKPEVAYVKPAAQHRDLTTTLNLTSTNNAGSNGFFGPIAILLRSEKEIIFSDQVDSSPSFAPVGHRAKQVRAELIESIEFAP
jgi:hypothetical protein